MTEHFLKIELTLKSGVTRLVEAQLDMTDGGDVSEAALSVAKYVFTNDLVRFKTAETGGTAVAIRGSEVAFVRVAPATREIA